MPRDTITLRLSGDVFLDDYLFAIRQFHALVRALSQDVAQGVEVKWSIDDLSGGSTVTTLRGIAREEERQPAVERIVRAYEDTGTSLERGLDIPYSYRVIRAARAIAGLLDGRIDEILFETDETEAVISSVTHAPSGKSAEAAIYSYGAIEGRVQMLSSRTGLKFTLYDVFGRGIPCHLQEGDEDMMRDAWDKWVVVEGRIRRDPEGRPISIRKITNVVIREPGETGDYRKARGALRVRPDAPSPEEAIRRLRDG
jgi:hypothetical protein